METMNYEHATDLQGIEVLCKLADNLCTIEPYCTLGSCMQEHRASQTVHYQAFKRFYTVSKN